MSETREKVVAICDQVIKKSLIAFIAGVALVFGTVAWVNTYAVIAPIFLFGVLLLLVSGPVYICTIIFRDIHTLGYVRWQFSLRGMLTIVTLVALLLGAGSVMFNHFRGE